MNETQKPFACNIEGCDMTFTNEDHLNWHHKKHDMILNLGLANKNSEVADQTPTPTRFIRNCEEVGLFQDLQNVNPFDETFKKAIENTKSGQLHVPEPTNDDSLHTPHIFPHIETTRVEKFLDNINRTDNQSNAFCINHIENNSTIEKRKDNAQVYDLTVSSPESDGRSPEGTLQGPNLKSKLKEAIRNKEKKTPRSVIITPVPLEKLKPNEEVNSSTTQGSPQICNNNKGCANSKDDNKDKIRAMNRAAQLRCRKRKQLQLKKMEEDLGRLKTENQHLTSENQIFKHKFAALKQLVIDYRKNKPNQEQALLGDLEKILNSSIKLVRKDKPKTPVNTSQKTVIKSKSPSGVQMVPLPILQNSTPVKPVYIQVVGSVAQLAVSVLPKQ